MEIDPKRVNELTPVDLTNLMYLWGFWARDSQLPPPGGWVGWPGPASWNASTSAWTRGRVSGAEVFTW